MGNLTFINYPVSPDITLAYDALNRLTNMVDAVGTTLYSYDQAGQLLSEDGPWAGDTVNYAYANRLRTGLSVSAPNASPWVQRYAYDSMRRLTNVASAAGSFGYNYITGGEAEWARFPETGQWYDLQNTAGSLVQTIALPNGAYITNTFDTMARMTGTALANSGGTNLDAENYLYNLGSQRTQQVFTAGNYMNYTYDNIGELKTALGKEPGGVTNRMQEQLGYFYDAAGNLNFRTNNTLLQDFNVNSLNELTTVTNGGNLTVAGSATGTATNVTVNTSNSVLYVDQSFACTNQPWANGNNTYTAIAKDTLGQLATNASTAYLLQTNIFAYDVNGNLLTNAARVFEYDDENQLIRITQPNAWKSEFTYDGKMRRRIRKEYTWTGSWVETNEVHYVYDGNLEIQERDGNNLPQVTYTQGTDMSGSPQGAGGIGGLLARTSNSQLLYPGNIFATALYHSDGNGNVTCLIYTNMQVSARYQYDPFGSVLTQSGALADANLYRFSSKEYHQPSGLVYYLYRYYDPNLQRWVNRDPIEERGGVNLYQFVKNNLISKIDALGLTAYDWSPEGCGKGLYMGFIQVSFGGSVLRPFSFVDDGSHGGSSDSPSYRPLYPNPPQTLSPPGDRNAFTDDPSFVSGQKFEVCRVCLKPCCKSYTYYFGRGGSGTISYSGYSIVGIGPCRSYTVVSGLDKQDLDYYAAKSDSPSAKFLEILAASYPNALKGDCIHK